MGREQNPATVKSKSYVRYAQQVIGQGYVGNTGDAKDYKANDQRVQVTLTQPSISKATLEKSTESRQNFKKYASRSTLDNDSIDMINNLKSTNVALGYVRHAGNNYANHQKNARSTIDQEIGQTKNMYTYVQKRDFASNVLPSNANAGQMKPLNAHVNANNKSMNQSTFKWNNFKSTM